MMLPIDRISMPCGRDPGAVIGSLFKIAKCYEHKMQWKNLATYVKSGYKDIY